jgi:hypothetical protein
MKKYLRRNSLIYFVFPFIIAWNTYTTIIYWDKLTALIGLCSIFFMVGVLLTVLMSDIRDYMEERRK